MDNLEDRAKDIEEKLDSIRTSEGNSHRIGCGIIIGLFRAVNYEGGFSAGEIAFQLKDGKWFKGNGEDSAQIMADLEILEKYKLLFKFPDGKYVYRDFK